MIWQLVVRSFDTLSKRVTQEKNQPFSSLMTLLAAVPLSALAVEQMPDAKAME
jgi:hypothetical protein